MKLTRKTCFAVSRGTAEVMDISGIANNVGIISISSTNSFSAELQGAWNHTCRLVFDDVDEYLDGLVPFSDTLANDLVNWLKPMINELDFLIVHCDAGLSRSPAVVISILETFIGDKTIHKRYSMYNRLVYRKLVQAFNRNK